MLGFIKGLLLTLLTL